ncbi:MAG: methylated-DNA--[protein]-cysteine S-methyltransferase [Bifidobacteriaceae bacterium]|jgi:methylated-DNA-[protein]-cysteine S-methyltransferase|nr:methylated-DNA--[protein]-cysteine S-methyltransferase [Bifidobacteriaceae bacterium]
MTVHSAVFDSPLGPLVGAAQDGAVTGLWFEGQRHYPDANGWSDQPDDPVLRRLGAWLSAYFEGARPGADFPLAPQGSAFRQAVWALLRQIPYGQTTTYGRLAGLLTASQGRGTSARAVGGAVGHNPISLVVPCHRVIGAGGALTGYAGGLDRKVALLELERGGARDQCGGPR